MTKKKRKRKEHRAPIKQENAKTIPSSVPFVVGLVLDILLLILVIVLVCKLVSHAGETKFFTDECYHAYIIELSAEHGRVPAFLPDIFSGSGNIQPPLFHWTGGFMRMAFGEGSTPYLNILFLTLMLIVMYLLIRFHVHPNAARLSLPFIMSVPLIHGFSLALYLELITALTCFTGVFLLFLAFQKNRYSYYIYAGLGGAAMLLSKITGIIILPFYFICFVYYLIRYLFKRGEFRTTVGPVITAAVSLAASMLFFAIATDSPMLFAKRVLVRPVRYLVEPKIRAFLQTDEQGEKAEEEKITKPEEFWGSFPKKQILGNAAAGTGYLMLAGIALAFIHLIVRLGRTGTLWIFVYFIYAFLVLLFGPGAAPRHFIAILPLGAFLGGHAVHDLGDMLNRLAFREEGSPFIRYARAIGLVGVLSFLAVYILSAVAIGRMPNHRLTGVKGVHMGNISPQMLQPIEYVRDNTPEDSMVFAVWTYSTMYYSGRPATWGANARGLHDIYFVKDPDELLKRLREAGITHVIIDNTRIFPDDKYNTVVFTKTMVGNLLELIHSGRARIVWPKMDKIVMDRTVLLPVVPPDLEKIPENAAAFVLAVVTPQGPQRLPPFIVVELDLEGEVRDTGESSREEEQE
jgi:hypothetical protein